MNKKNYSKPETTLFELKYRTSILQASPEKPEPDPSGDGSGSETRLNSNDAQYLWT